MLTAVVLYLRPVTTCRLPLWHGRLVHAAALALLEQIIPKLAQSLHDSHDLKPLTVSPLAGTEPTNGQDCLLTEERVYPWRLTGLSSQISQHLAQMAREGTTVRIGQVIFVVETVGTGGSDPEARRDSYEALLDRWQRRKAPRKVRLQVLTPATFKKNRHDQPFPLPRLVFGSLLDTWNRFSPFPLGDLHKLIDDSIMMGEWEGVAHKVRLGTHRIPGGEYHEYRRTGFTGDFTYWVANPESQVGMVMSLLADYSFFAGIGSLTAQGMGQVRPRFHRLATSE